MVRFALFLSVSLLSRQAACSGIRFCNERYEKEKWQMGKKKNAKNGKAVYRQECEGVCSKSVAKNGELIMMLALSKESRERWGKFKSGI